MCNASVRFIVVGFKIRSHEIHDFFKKQMLFEEDLTGNDGSPLTASLPIVLDRQRLRIPGQGTAVATRFQILSVR